MDAFVVRSKKKDKDDSKDEDKKDKKKNEKDDPAKKRIRAERTDRVSVMCKTTPECGRILNKDSTNNHNEKHHPTVPKHLWRYSKVEKVPASQPTLNFSVKGEAEQKTLDKKHEDATTSKPARFMSVPKIPKSSSSRLHVEKSQNVSQLIKQFDGKDSDFVSNLTKFKTKLSNEKLQSVLSKLKEATPENYEKILQPYKKDIEEFQAFAQNCGPLIWNKDTKMSSNDSTIPANLRSEFGIVRTVSGGDCLHGAISNLYFGSEDLNMALRLTHAKHLIENQNDIKKAERVFGKGYDEMFKSTVSYGCQEGWGDDVTMYMYSNILKRPIVTIQTNINNINSRWKERNSVLYDASHGAEKRGPIPIFFHARHFEPIINKVVHPEIDFTEGAKNNFWRFEGGYKFSDQQVAGEVLGVINLERQRKFGDEQEFLAMQTIKINRLTEKVQRGEITFEDMNKELIEDEKMFYENRDISLISQTGTRNNATGKDSEKNTGSQSDEAPTSSDLTETTALDQRLKIDEHDHHTQELKDLETTLHIEGKRKHDEIESQLSGSIDAESAERVSLGSSDIIATQAELLHRHNLNPFDNERIIKIEEDIKEIKDNVCRTTQLLENLSLESNTSHSINERGVPENFREVVVDFEKIKSIDQLLEACPSLFKHKDKDASSNEAFTHLRCQMCFKEGKTIGNFSYLSSTGTDFTNDIQPREFRNLKNNVKQHLANVQHENVTAMMEKVNWKEKEKQTGLLLGSLAYESITQDHSYKAYERKVAAASLRNQEVGDINHSDDFCAKFGYSVFITLQDTLRKNLIAEIPATGRSTPFAIVADKYTATATRSAGQIVGVVAYINGKITDVLVEDKQVKKLDGKSLADDIILSVQTVMSDDVMKERCVGGCFDGQYFHEKVPSHLKKFFPTAEDESKGWLSFEWDPSHIIERAVKDGYNSLPSNSLLKKTKKVVHTLNDFFTSGKQYVEMKELAAEHDQRLYAPIQSSQTRFAANEYESLLNFSRNYNLIREQYQTRNVISEIDHFGFASSLAFQQDIYNQISKLSGSAQTLGKPGWRIDTHFEETLQTLQDMVKSLPDTENSELNLDKHFVHLRQATQEFRENSTFHGVAVTAKAHPTTQLRSTAETAADTSTSDSAVTDEDRSYMRSLVNLKREATTFINKFKEGCVNRKTKYSCGSNINDLCATSFKLDNIIANAESEVVPQEFTQLFRQSVDGGSIKTDLCEAEVEYQYTQLTLLVKKEFDKMMSRGGELSRDQEKLEKHIYQHIFNNKHEQEIDVAADLYLSSVLRSRAESCVESMGSVVKKISEYRPALNFTKLSQDAFTVYNGPPFYTQEANMVVKESLDRHFPNGWHFHRTSAKSKLETWTTSKVVDNVKKEGQEKSRLCFQQN